MACVSPVASRLGCCGSVVRSSVIASRCRSEPLLAQDFKPSGKSLSPQEQTIKALRYLRRASELVEARILEDGEAPPWVQAKIQESALHLGMAVSYLRHQNSKEPK